MGVGYAFFCTRQNVWRCWLTTPCVNVVKLRMESNVICMATCTDLCILNVKFVKLYSALSLPILCRDHEMHLGSPLVLSLPLERRITKCLSK